MTTNQATGQAAVRVAEAAQVELRELATHEEREACVALQRATWGASFAEYVPAAMLKITQLVGGVSGGAFTEDGRLVGFVYGLTGVRDGRLVHWSHMLAVVPEYRDHGVGRRLKEYQRGVLSGLGVETIQWTFDPLVARNAHLNLNRLGASVDAYVPDMYGNTGSDLHAFGTDRFIVSWPVAGSQPRVSSRDGWGGAPLALAAVADAPVVRVDVPRDVESMAVAEARTWRATTRQSFLHALDRGYGIVGFVSGASSCSYILMR